MLLRSLAAFPKSPRFRIFIERTKEFSNYLPLNRSQSLSYHPLALTVREFTEIRRNLSRQLLFN